MYIRGSHSAETVDTVREIMLISIIQVIHDMTDSDISQLTGEWLTPAQRLDQIDMVLDIAREINEI